MKILMIGNGFDLEHDLPTKYTDFLNFVKDFENAYLDSHSIPQSLYKIENEYVKSLFDTKDTRIASTLKAYTENNLWLTYFKKVHKEHLKNKENWIDFESEISSIIQLIDELIKYYYNISIGGLENKSMYNYYIKALSDFLPIYNLDKNIIKSNISTLINDLNRLICALEIYISDFINNKKIEFYNPDIDKIFPDAVISFNYSDTYKRLYAYNRQNIKYDFLHGKAKKFELAHLYTETYEDEFIKKNVEKNNMVLGIDEYLEDDRKSKEVDFISFKKFYQRIYKQTGNQYKKWLEDIDKNSKQENTLYIFGHSLDVTDGDVLSEFINHPQIRTVIFYKNKSQLGQQIENLVKVLGSDNVIEKVYGKNHSIEFRNQKDRIKIMESEFEIFSDTFLLENLHKSRACDSIALLSKIDSKIKNEEISYFYSQENVITLFYIIQKMGLEKIYTNKLLNIAYKLMKNESLKEPIQFSPDKWSYQDYDNSFGYDTKTKLFIDKINQYNKNNFILDVLNNYEDKLMEYQIFIRDNIEITEDKYIEILNDLFKMFNDSSSDINKLWDVLVKISMGPAKLISIDILLNLIKKSSDAYKIVMYNYLLSKIEKEEYFSIQLEMYENSIEM